jgi:hypothetical protein
MLQNWWQSGWSWGGSTADEVEEAGDGIGSDSEAIGKVGPERDGVLLAGLFQREESVPALPAVLATSAAAGFSVTAQVVGLREAVGRRTLQRNSGVAPLLKANRWPVVGGGP